jgi:hypothetical protein
MALAIWSKGRRVANTPNVCTNGLCPDLARAPAMPIMFASAMPQWMNRSGMASWNKSISHWRVRSPVRQTMSSRWRANSRRARP